ncbi:MAG: ankyrin repeat domain-containing protein [Candidatus Babeliales bacterium]|jgi:hypothetical protein
MKKIIFLVIFCSLGITNNSAAMCPWFGELACKLCCCCCSAQPEQYQLLSAIKTGNMSAVKELFSKESDLVAELWPDCPLELRKIIGEYCSDIDAALIDKHGGATLLHAAAAQGDSSMVQLLIDRGYDLGCKDSEGHTPLHVAIMMGNADAVEALIRAGAAVNEPNAEGDTPLAYAVFYGCHVALGGNTHEDLAKKKGIERSRIVPNYVQCVRLLLEAGANPNCVIIMKCIHEAPILHVAVACGKADMVRLLLEFKADPMVQVNGPMVQVNGRIAIDFAETEEIRNLLGGGSISN